MMTGPWSKQPHQPRNMLPMRATVLLGSSAYHWRVVRWWMRPSRLFTDFRDGRVPIYGLRFCRGSDRAYTRENRMILRLSGDPGLLAFTSNPSRVINVTIRAIAAGGLPGRHNDQSSAQFDDPRASSSVAMAMACQPAGSAGSSSLPAAAKSVRPAGFPPLVLAPRSCVSSVLLVEFHQRGCKPRPDHVQ